jgi:DNA-binding LacI/PurR family transcriptional regulator
MSTIAKVAERAGVSRTTVSHAINHADRVSKNLRERVQAAIDDLGYVPNLQAQSLRTGRTNMVAILIPDILNPFFAELVKGLQTELESHGLDALIYNTDVPGGHAQEHGAQYLRQFTQKRVDGVIIGDFALQGLTDSLRSIDLPSVFIGHLPNKAVDTVQLDDFGGAYAAAAHLAERGYRRIALVSGPKTFLEADERTAGFKQALVDTGLSFDRALQYEGTYLQHSGQEAATWLANMSALDRPTAVFFANSLMAIGGLSRFYDLGIKVPDDIAVATFDDIAQLEYVRPRLTTTGNRPAALAAAAVAMLGGRLAGDVSGPARSTILPCRLQVHETS